MFEELPFLSCVNVLTIGTNLVLFCLFYLFFVSFQSRLTSAASAQQKSALVQIEGYVKGNFF